MIRFYTERRRWLPLVLGLLALALVMAGAATRGSLAIPLDALVGMLLTRLPITSIPATWPESWGAVFFQIRLPRVVQSMLVGAALAASGATYQGLLRNPLADPYLIGAASGAALGAIAILAIGPETGPFAPLVSRLIPLAAFIGALGATVLIYGLARVGRTTPISLLILSGIAVGSFLTAVTSFLMYWAGDRLRQMLVWLLGSFTLSNWGQVQISAPYIVIGLAIMIALSRALNVLQLDEEQASQLGLNVELVKALLVIGASLATAAAVSVSGLIGFVGLVVPHIVRLVWGPDHRLLIPMSAIVGGGFLVIADTIARTILLPNELPVGIITAFCGAPFFLWLLRKRKELFF